MSSSHCVMIGIKTQSQCVKIDIMTETQRASISILIILKMILKYLSLKILHFSHLVISRKLSNSNLDTKNQRS